MKTLIALGILAVSFCSQFFVRNHVKLPELPSTTEYLGISIDPKILKRLLGVRLFFADLVWIDTLIKADTEKVKEPFSRFYQAAKVITTLDPDHFTAYYVSGLYLSVIKDDIKGATALLRDGAHYIQSAKMESHKDAWRVFYILGYNLLLEEHDFEEGPLWLARAADHPNAPEIVKSLGGKLKSERGRLEVGQKVLADFRQRLQNPDEIKRVDEKILELTARQELLEMNERFENYLRTTGAFALPRKRAFDLFLRSTGFSRRDLRGRELTVNESGNVVIEHFH